VSLVVSRYYCDVVKKVEGIRGLRLDLVVNGWSVPRSLSDYAMQSVSRSQHDSREGNQLKVAVGRRREAQSK
jgi:hypothetical protein